MEKASCKNCQSIDFKKRDELDGRLVGKYRYGCSYSKSGYICGVVSSDEKLEILACPGWIGSCKQTVDVEEISEKYDRKLQELYARWNLWRQVGAPDAVMSDGIYLNNLRQGIQALLRQIERELPEEEYPECYFSPLPPVMDEAYMADTNEIRRAAERAIETYKKNADYQWVSAHFCELPNDAPETGQAYHLLCHKENLQEAILDEDILAMKRASNQRSLYEELALCKKRMEKRLYTGKRKRKKNSEKVPIIGQMDIAELKVS